RKSARRIDLTGGVKIDDEQRHVTSELASFFFDNAHHVERIEAEHKVVLIDAATGRKGVGEKAIYLVAKKLMYLSGSPAVVTDPRGSDSGQNIEVDLVRNKVLVLSPTGALQGTYK